MKQSKKLKAQPELRAESRAAEAATAAWMLSVLVVLGCELGFAGLRGWLALQPDQALAAAGAELLLFSALVIGLVALLLTPVVLRSRRVLPPRGLTIFAVVVAAAPLLALLVRLVR